MLVLDSNVWVIAIATEPSEHVAVRDRVLHGDERALVDAYIYREVLAGFERSQNVSGTEVRRAIEDFTGMISSSTSIEGPSHEAVRDIGLRQVRRSRENVTLGRVLRIQPRDAPIVTLATKHVERGELRGDDEPETIVTSDRAFSEFDPEAFDLDISMTYLPYGG